MTVTGIFWPFINSRDIHLLPGLVSPRLDQLLMIKDTTGNTWASSPHAGVTVAFTPQFSGAPDSHGVRVNTSTGEVSVDDRAWLSAPRLRSFLIEIVVADPTAATPFSTRIRVQVHEKVTRMWLTPSPLTVRLTARNVRLSVLAAFDDGTIGDISNWAATDPPNAAARTFVHAKARAFPELVWSSQPPGSIGVNPDTGVLVSRAAGRPATIVAQRAGPPSIDPANTATGTRSPPCPGRRRSRPTSSRVPA